MEDLDESISSQRDTLALYSLDHSDRFESLNNLANDLLIRYDQLGNSEDLEECILLDREALTLRPPGHPDRSESLNNLANDIGTRYEQFGNMDDCEECISLNRDALALRPLDHPDRSSTLNNLATAFSDRYEKLGKVEDLEECIALHRDALTLRPPGHPRRFTSLNNLARALRHRYAQLGRMHDLEECISLNREGLVLRPPDNSDDSGFLIEFAVALSDRYVQSGKWEDLEECILLNHEALAFRPHGHPGRSTALNNLADALRNLYSETGNMMDLEECILLNHEALTLRPLGDPLRSTSLNNLANAYRNRYAQLGKIEDLQECVALNQEAVTLRPIGHPLRYTSLNNYANALWNRYSHLGKIQDLEACISLNRDALALLPPGHPDRSSSLINLAISLNDRYVQLGKSEDLDICIALNEEALALRPLGHPRRSTTLHNLADALRIRYAQSDNTDDLEQCISLIREALALRTPDHPDRSSSLNILAIALSDRYDRLGRLDDLEECISLNYDALALRPPGHPDRSMSLGNLSVVLRDRYAKLGKIEDLHDCISLNREALTLSPLGHPLRSLSLINLADALSKRSKKTEEMDDVQEMFTYYELAATDTTSYLQDRLRAASKWAEHARCLQHQSMLNAFDMALQLLQRSLTSRPDVEVQQQFLATAKIPRNLASDAASAAILNGKLELAVEFLEQGRSMLWSRVDAYKYPLEQLRQVEGGGELADRFEELGASLERLVLLSNRSDGKSSMGGISFDAQVTQHRVLSEEWEAVVGRIRETPGFAHFLRTPPFETLRSAAAEGPVILINISDYQSDAIILTIENPPVLVPLSTVNPVDLADQVPRLTSNRGIISVLRYLWENVVSPVVTQLSKLGIGEGSRIWWCPTGELCALPLHAAGPYRLGEPNLPDLYISSYTSTLSSLIRARSNLVKPPGVPKLLVVGQPQTLQRVEDEVQNIKQHVQAVDDLFGADASRDAVLDGLTHHSWVHFSCHGHLGEDDKPFNASFELYDECRLTLLQLIQARLPNAESAFLAACHSAAGDSRTPDESLHLAAALQFCGFRSVVGTLWEMYDRDAPMMSKEYYKYMFRDPEKIDFRDSAYALSAAIQEMRKARLPPERWVMFVHIGA